MINLHFKAKFRAFGITIATIEDTRDVTPLLRAFFPQLPATIPLGKTPATLYNDRGVLIELVG